MVHTSIVELDARTYGAECMAVRPPGAGSSRSNGWGPSCSREVLGSNYGKNGGQK